MPSIRIGYSSEFVLRNELVGIGSTATSSRLDVAGQIRSENTAGSGGVSTFREYQGFSQTEAELSNEVLIDNGSSGTYSSLTGEIKITEETTVSSGSTVEVGKTKTLTVTDRFAVPLGETNNRDNAPEAGTTRFNQDFGTLEFFDGVNWKTVNSYARPSASGRGVFAGGYDFTNPGQNYISTIEFIQIPTLGNISNFGDLLAGKRLSSGCSSSTRGLNSGGLTPSTIDVIEYVTIAAGGNSIDFGNLTVARYAVSAVSSSTRGISGGGYHPSYKNELDYVEIATVGNALDFGNLSAGIYGPAGVSNGTRGLFGGGERSAPAGQVTHMDVITIASKGDAVKFGDLTYKSYGLAAASNSTTGIYGGGSPAVSNTNKITIASDGNVTDFGNLTVGRRSLSATASQTRVVFAGGITGPSASDKVNTIDYVNIASAGNAQDFGDLSRLIEQQSAFSDSHGGLGGF